MFSGNICNSNPFPNKHKQLVCLCKSKVTHALPYPASPLGLHMKGMLLPISKKSLFSYYASSR